MSGLFGAIEAGGTRWNLGVFTADGEAIERARIATTRPDETIGQALAFFEKRCAGTGYAAIGIASFGPIELRPGAARWGYMLDTPKAGWAGTDIVGPFRARLRCPAGFDTDVNGAALAEHLWGAARGCANAVYITVGTGIGGGAIIRGEPVHGFRHPEMGHVAVGRHPDDRDFPGVCPFHGDCMEGLASGPAIRARWGCSLSELAADHPGRRIIADYLGQLAIMQMALLSCERIVFGGGVLETPGLLDMIRAEAKRRDNGYFGYRDLAEIIVPPALGERAGLMGGLALAQRALAAQADEQRGE